MTTITDGNRTSIRLSSDILRIALAPDEVEPPRRAPSGRTACPARRPTTAARQGWRPARGAERSGRRDSPSSRRRRKAQGSGTTVRRYPNAWSPRSARSLDRRRDPDLRHPDRVPVAQPPVRGVDRQVVDRLPYTRRRRSSAFRTVHLGRVRHADPERRRRDREDHPQAVALDDRRGGERRRRIDRRRFAPRTPRRPCSRPRAIAYGAGPAPRRHARQHPPDWTTTRSP